MHKYMYMYMYEYKHACIAGSPRSRQANLPSALGERIYRRSVGWVAQHVGPERCELGLGQSRRHTRAVPWTCRCERRQQIGYAALGRTAPGRTAPHERIRFQVSPCLSRRHCRRAGRRQLPGCGRERTPCAARDRVSCANKCFAVGGKAAAVVVAAHGAIDGTLDISVHSHAIAITPSRAPDRASRRPFDASPC